MSKGSSRRTEDRVAIANNWDKVFGHSGRTNHIMGAMNKMEGTNFELVEDFMLAFGQDVELTPIIPDRAITELRLALIEEEVDELREALRKNDVVEVADALTDILYVVYGAGLSFGIDLDACFLEVHESNMSKLGDDGQPIYREDGKVLKGARYFSPQLALVMGLEDDQ
jgi:predicted HAD superfamily Cof-like phosphohydrolase